MRRTPLEASVRTRIDLRLRNLGWVLDHRDPQCNVTQEQAKTDWQHKLLKGNRPDYLLYESGTDIPIAVIEAKRPGEDLDKAVQKSIELYAAPLQIPLVFTFNDTFVLTRHAVQRRPLKIDGEELQDFVDQFTALRFLHEGSEILSAPKGVNFTREQLTAIFKNTNNLLRKEGLRDGYERFSAFSEILFLKLIDESEKLNEHKGLPRTIQEHYCWSSFTKEYSGNKLLDFIRDTVWKRLHREYGEIFNNSLGVRNGSTLDEIVKSIDQINLSATDTDIKGDAFEFFLKTVTNGNKDLGEYFTPRHVVRTMVNIVKPAFGEKVYDPFCGTGGFLLEAFKYLSNRADTSNQQIIKKIKTESIYGGEITSTARIAKMNMVLFGDGHSNVEQIDSLAHPRKPEFNVVLSNIPYSQKTEYGGMYGVKTQDGDAVCMRHIWESLLPNGRAAVIVPETFLYEGGAIGETRELIAKGSESLTVVSLPRGVFMPYTPTKTNIIYFKKGKPLKNVYFFVVFNDGFELKTKRKPIAGDSDIKKLLSQYDEPQKIKGQANIVPREEIENSEQWNLRPFFYMEDVPDSSEEMVYLGSDIVVEKLEKIDPREDSDKLFTILEISQNGVFISDQLYGYEFTQSYKVVNAGDLVYNPYRINIGSIGLVPSHYDGMLVSPAYIVFKSKNENYPASYIQAVLKSPRYMRVIMNYSLSSARANLPFSELARIKIPKPKQSEIMNLQKMEKQLDEYRVRVNEISDTMQEYIKKAIPIN